MSSALDSTLVPELTGLLLSPEFSFGLSSRLIELSWLDAPPSIAGASLVVVEGVMLIFDLLGSDVSYGYWSLAALDNRQYAVSQSIE